jgi:prevent-host-death family protein
MLSTLLIDRCNFLCQTYRIKAASPMVTIATDQAKAQLAELVHRASRGETILITESGHPMAKLVPADESLQHALTQEQALQALRDIRSRSRLTPGETLNGLIEEGRKY